MKIIKRILPVFVMFLAFAFSTGTFYAIEIKEECSEHVYPEQGKVIEAPTCASQGKVEYTCERCGYTRIQIVKKTEEHIEGEGQIYILAGPSTPGKKQYFCTVCNKYLRTESYELDLSHYDGWVEDGGKRYYLDEDGVMLKDTWIKDGGCWYYLGKSGAMLSNGWIKDGGYWYYLTESDAMATDSWLWDGTNWYYLNADGTMATGWYSDGTNWYYFDESGVWVA